MLLSTHRKRRYKSDPGDYRSPRIEEPTLNTGAPFTHPEGGKTVDSTPQPGDPLLEFDEYGTELHRDARVWKVYVKETDKYDTDLVKGWNDSTDVILIFAALFSAVSAAFLIESTKTLQSDPAEVSARTLLDISRTLRVIANRTESESLEPSSSSPPDFVPSHTAICINTLWYLSLSLSLATSFIAILSKDWCHSFMTGRTGHPFSQTLRRQRKWDMLERWRMAELLAVLPSMIHVALLLFAVGLCIQLWNTHLTVALPVICVSGLSFGFYVWSSVVAALVDYFPYPTIISKLCRTEIVLRIARPVYHVGSQLVQNLPLLRPLFYLLVVRVLQHLVVVPTVILGGIDCLLNALLSMCNIRRTSNWFLWVLRFFTMPLHKFVYFLIWKPIDKVSGWLVRFFYYLNSAGDSAALRISKLDWQLDPKLSVISKTGGIGQAQDRTISMAISWIIKNCEVPQSVDVALQSIAGAGKGFVAEPLKDCNAAVEVSKRLASSKLYRVSDARKVVSLYSRALSFLSSNPNQGSKATPRASGNNLEVMLSDIQTHIENSVASLMMDGQFQASKNNLEALRIGNTATSHALMLMKDNTGSANNIFAAIHHLLDQHFDKEPLHSSALLSLVDAVLLLSLFGNHLETTLPSPARCMVILDRRRHRNIPTLRAAVVGCLLLKDGLSYGPPEAIILGLTDLQARTSESSDLMAEFGIEELCNAPINYGLGSPRPHLGAIRGPRRAIEIHSAAATLKTGSIRNNVLQCIQALETIYRLIRIGVPDTETYVFVLTMTCRHPASRPQCWQILSKVRFPRSPGLLLRFLKEYSTVELLAQEMKSPDRTMRIFATGQLWLLFTLSLHYGHDELQWLVAKHAPRDIKREPHRSQCKHFGNLIIKEIQDRHEAEIFNSLDLGVYVSRLAECMFQSCNSVVPQKINDALCDVPQELRGLSSFLDSRPPPGAASEVEAAGIIAPFIGPTETANNIPSSNDVSMELEDLERGQASNQDSDAEDLHLDHHPQDGRGDHVTGSVVGQGTTEGETPGNGDYMRQITDEPQDSTQDRGGVLDNTSVEVDVGGGERTGIRGGMIAVSREQGEGELEVSGDNMGRDGPGSDAERGRGTDHIAIDMPHVAKSGSQNNRL